MQYLLMIYEAEAKQEAMPEDERKAIFQEYAKFTEDLIAQGKFKAGDALQSAKTATSVRVQDGKTVTTDGPFAETREQLGGYYLVECADLDDAIAIAAKIPTSRTGTIEIRPIVVHDWSDPTKLP
ncbi:MAG: YciI family protein [Myxococcota bacterium]